MASKRQSSSHAVHVASAAGIDPGIFEVLEEAGFALTTGAPAEPLPEAADVLVLDADLDDDACRTLATGFHGVVLLLVDSYSPDALARTLELDVDAFVQKSVPSREIVRVVRQELVAREAGDVRPSQTANPDAREIVGGSAPMKDVCRLLARTAPSEIPVLITGESGTGKELVARAIHRLSPRRKARFVAVNCGAIPADLIESELFGHEKGAFTGATRQKAGVFETADGGTLFLDEIGELPLAMQVKLLRVLEDQRFERVGGTETVTSDVRLLFATNRNLEEAVDDGSFRADLYYRIDVLRIEVPPLRKRKSDIQSLWEHFVREAADREGRHTLETHPDVIRLLMRYDWPGNVRELRNLAHQAVVRRSTGEITPRLVQDRLGGAAETSASRGRLDSHRFTPRSLEEIERAAIIRTYLAVDSVRRAAEILEISERKMYYRLKEYREAGFLVEETEGERTPRVLIAHPDRDAYDRLGAGFDSFETRWIEDGLALIDHVHRNPPAAVVAAVNLPVLDGINILELSYEQGWSIPIVVVGDEADEQARDYVDALGATAFVREDVPPDELAWVVETALSTTAA